MRWWWLLGAAWLLTRRRAEAPDVAWGNGWTFPAPDLATTAALVTQGFAAGHHPGVDITYRLPAGWGAPSGTPVLAARAGKVRSVAPGRRGTAIVLDHGAPWATFYQHLSSSSVAPGDIVAAGDRLGEMGADPTDPQHVVHLHFATWYQGAGDDHSVDPASMLSTAARMRID